MGCRMRKLTAAKWSSAYMCWAVPYLHTMQISQLDIAVLVQVQHLKEVGDDVDSAHEEIAQVILHAFAQAAPTL